MVVVPGKTDPVAPGNPKLVALAGVGAGTNLVVVVVVVVCPTSKFINLTIHLSKTNLIVKSQNNFCQAYPLKKQELLW